MDDRDPRFQPPPRMPAHPPGRGSGQGSGKSTNWGKIFLIGCGVLMLLFVACGAIGFYAFNKIRVMAHDEMVAQMDRQMASIETSETITDEQKALLGELATLTHLEGASFMGVSLIVGVVADTVGDDEIDEEELADLEAIRDFLEPSGADVGMGEWARFMEAHPNMQDSYSKMQYNF